VNVLVAEESKRIAMAAKRDSAAMKTISILTLVYLPGTFIAVCQILSPISYFMADILKTVFSAGIFDFNPGSYGSRIGVSRFWWVYLLATACLTFTTVTIWLFYIRWRTEANRREEEDLKNAT
jgi:hypothetical protein